MVYVFTLIAAIAAQYCHILGRILRVKVACGSTVDNDSKKTECESRIIDYNKPS